MNDYNTMADDQFSLNLRFAPQSYIIKEKCLFPKPL
jgi:hypothetical protein